jgi:hypothetical protein
MQLDLSYPLRMTTSFEMAARSGLSFISESFLPFGVMATKVTRFQQHVDTAKERYLIV